MGSKLRRSVEVVRLHSGHGARLKLPVMYGMKFVSFLNKEQFLYLKGKILIDNKNICIANKK